MKRCGTWTKQLFEKVHARAASRASLWPLVAPDDEGKARGKGEGVTLGEGEGVALGEGAGVGAAAGLSEGEGMGSGAKYHSTST